MDHPHAHFGPLQRWRYLYVERVSTLIVVVLAPLGLVQLWIGAAHTALGIAIAVASLALTVVINRAGWVETASRTMTGSTTLVLLYVSEVESVAAMLFASTVILGAGVLHGPRAALALTAFDAAWLVAWGVVHPESSFFGSVAAGSGEVPIVLHLAVLATTGGIAAFVGTMASRTISELEAQRRALLDAVTVACTDGLTSLHNRLSLQRRLEEEVARSRRHKTAVSVVMIDIDHFKSVNDTYGHAGGDAGLRAAGALLRSLARESDAVGRYGGEEFAAVLPHSDLGGARVFAERVRTRLAATDISCGGRSFRMTVSVGVAELLPGDADGGALLARADEALYAAKRGGRDRVVVHQGRPLAGGTAAGSGPRVVGYGR